MGVAVVDDEIVVCGGYDGHSALSSVEAFSVESASWSPLPPMREARCAMASVALDGYVYGERRRRRRRQRG